MRPPWSMIIFTTLAGAGQGLLLLLVALDLLNLTGIVTAPTLLFTVGAALVLLLAGGGLIAATFHLGRPMRAWRAVAMWRTSWLSREVIVLPAFMAVVALWGAGHFFDRPLPIAGAVAAALALLLYLCTGMIYGAVKAIRAWATPMTPLNFALIGIASGALLVTALVAALAPALVPGLAAVTLAATLLAAATRGATLWRNLHLPAKTTLQTAIGMRHPRIRQISQGSMGGSFNTREFFHHQTDGTVQRVRWTAALLGFVLPTAVLLLPAPSAGLLAALCLLQLPGLLAERWSFFAEGEHTQNLYYRAVG
jgi:sulfite dehydrogenase (quinone) subunit SoeC